MNCFWKCGAVKNDILENPQPLEQVGEDNISEIVVAPNPISTEAECDSPKAGCDSPNADCDSPEAECDSPEAECDSPEAHCKWYGTISTAYNKEKEYYKLKNTDTIYFGRFPIEWATNNEPRTGPNECEECFKNGIYHGVFIGYCMHCAIVNYKGMRGSGFISPGLENYNEDDNAEFVSAFDTYLKDVDLDLVGKEYIWYGFNVEMQYACYETDDENFL